MKRHHHRPGRDKEIIFGVNPVMEALRAGKRKFHRLYVKGGFKPGGPADILIEMAREKGVPTVTNTGEELNRLTDSDGHQGVAALVSPYEYEKLDDAIERLRSKPFPTLIALDSVQDPRNFGAIIRSAEAFGVDGIIFPQDRASTYTPTAAKASAGAGERMNLIKVVNLAETIRKISDEGYHCVALEEDAEENFDKAPEGPFVMVFGGEGVGVRPLVKTRCGHVAKIPMKGEIGSLNVSVAAAIALYIASLR
ncbi:MAG: 23S rRNA (guanosine(2251)-2'-O)-methyltransferase RlmB [Nitrospinae bacterium]|nr:23S rRNA (guanosine(2251)-2'-O)-methyltransferase RlmB [Nitrospinota bacterium]